MRSQPVVLLSVIAALPLAPAMAQDDELDRSPRSCVSISRIRDTDIIDDESILFYMAGRRVYRNVLDRPCQGLERAGRFMYRTRSSQLCNSDTVQALQYWGQRISPGMTCFLGEFYPITREEADILKLEPDERPGLGQQVKMSPIELPPDEVVVDEPAERDPTELATPDVELEVLYPDVPEDQGGFGPAPGDGPE
jgi:hypothetical protein